MYNLFVSSGTLSGLLDAVVDWLDSPDDTEHWWKLKTRVAELCLAEMRLAIEAAHRMPSVSYASEAARLSRAIPQVELMLAACHASGTPNTNTRAASRRTPAAALERTLAGPTAPAPKRGAQHKV